MRVNLHLLQLIHVNMKRIKEKVKAIWYILKGGQYAFFVISNGYSPGKKDKRKIYCAISDNASDLFLEAIVDFTDKYRTDLL